MPLDALLAPSLLGAPALYWVAVLTVFGFLLGSFFNVLIYRMPRDESVLWPPSHCTSCGHKVRPWENIPVLSYLVLRGRCSSCKSPIGPLYPLVELATGLLAAFLAVKAFGSWGERYPLSFVLGMAFFLLGSIPILVIDFKHFLIPDLVTLPGLALGLAFSFLPGGLSPGQSLLGALGAGGFLYLTGYVAGRLLKKEAMGFGDVKLLAMAGALFGFKTAMLGLLLASVLGCLVGFPLLLLRRLDGGHRIPFGPYLCAGIVLAAFYGQALLDWYFGLLGA